MPKILLKCWIIQQLFMINTRCNHKKKYDCYLKDYFLCQHLYVKDKKQHSQSAFADLHHCFVLWIFCIFAWLFQGCPLGNNADLGAFNVKCLVLVLNAGHLFHNSFFYFKNFWINSHLLLMVCYLLQFTTGVF